VLQKIDLNKNLQMSLWGIELPQMEMFSLWVVCVDKKKLRSTERIGPHHIDVLATLFGSLLGDAYAEKRVNATRICFQQENTNVEYLRNKLHSFFVERSYTNPKVPKLQKRIGVQNQIRFVCRFKTWSFQSFNWLHDIFYKKQNGNWIKVIPESQYLKTYRTPLALAIWIMGDGCKSGSGLKRSTNSFCTDDLLRLSNFLTEFYGLKNSINSAGIKDQYVIYIWKESMPKRISLVYLHMVPGMLYKLGITSLSMDKNSIVL
jgi:ubiquinol-cytochrome c reductase cytochrome b subunit